MSKYGKFISDNLMGKKLEIFVHLDSEWLSYQDGDAQAYSILLAIPKAYDEASGVLTLQGQSGHTFYMAEGCIEMFWEAGSGFKMAENSTSTLRPNRRKKKDRDIM